MKNTSLTHVGLAILRIVPSLLMIINHGLGKFNKLIAGGEIKFADPIGIGAAPSLFLAVIGEVVAPILIIIGLKTRWAAIPAAVTMAVAAFIQHHGDSIVTKEKSLLYLAFFIVIYILGPGKYSIDKN
ncbi:MAG: DoxX family protein [Flavobacteriaceae bacterium]|nr:DoxX family protein [Flavobacteriaceae bacterium]